MEQTLGIKITKTRQHWLNYFESITPKSHSELFEYDSTLAWNDKIGFRSGCASLYHPYDFENQKAYNYQVIPQIQMYMMMKKAKDMITTSKEVSRTTNISWHQRVCSSDYNWHKFYEELINTYHILCSNRYLEIKSGD